MPTESFFVSILPALLYYVHASEFRTLRLFCNRQIAFYGMSVNATTSLVLVKQC